MSTITSKLIVYPQPNLEFLLIPLPESLVSKHILKQLSIISQTLSSVNITPSGLNISVRKT